ASDTQAEPRKRPCVATHRKLVWPARAYEYPNRERGEDHTTSLLGEPKGEGQSVRELELSNWFLFSHPGGSLPLGASENRCPGARIRGCSRAADSTQTIPAFRAKPMPTSC